MATTKNGTAAAKGDSELDKLYKNYDILVNAKDKINEHQDVYEAILAATKGTAGAKRLAATFVSKFGPKIPSMNDASLDAMFDLLEDEDSQVRRTVVKVIPEMCVNSPQLSTKIADVLGQLLLAEDPTELSLVKNSLILVIRKYPKEAMAGLFSQVMGEDDMTREKCIEFVCNSIMKHKNELFAKNFETEQFFIEQIKQVLQDVSAEEFQQFVDVLLQLRTMATRKGAQDLVDIVANQADLSSDFQDTDADYMYRLITCYRQAVKICLERGASLDPFIGFVCHKVFPILPVMEAKDSIDDILQLFAQSFLCNVTVELAKSIIELLFDMLLKTGASSLRDQLIAFYDMISSITSLELILAHYTTELYQRQQNTVTSSLHYTPEPPAVDVDDSEAPTLQFTYVECLLFSFHKTVQLCPEFLAGEDSTDRLKDFRKRLQYFAHGCQLSHSRLEVTLKQKTNEDIQNIRKVAHATTGNINSLIKDFFHNPPSYKTKVKLSFLKEQPRIVVQASKRALPANDTTTSPAPKRKVSPIRFSSATNAAKKTPATSTGAAGKRQPWSVYEPPKGSYSNKLDTSGLSDSNWRGGWGRGRRNRRGGGRGRGTWRTGRKWT